MRLPLSPFGSVQFQPSLEVFQPLLPFELAQVQIFPFRLLIILLQLAASLRIMLDQQPPSFFA
jgi:hypothetical protein